MTPRIELLKEHFEMAHYVFLATVGDLTEGPATKRLPEAAIEPILPIYAHAVCVEDIVIARAAGQEPLAAGPEWAERTGIPVPVHLQTPEWSAAAFQLEGVAAYTEAVFARSLEWLESAAEVDLDREVDGLTPGSRAALRVLLRLSLVHLSSHGGEVAALKGVQGLKGLPF